MFNMLPCILYLRYYLYETRRCKLVLFTSNIGRCIAIHIMYHRCYKPMVLGDLMIIEASSDTSIGQGSQTADMHVLVVFRERPETSPCAWACCLPKPGSSVSSSLPTAGVMESHEATLHHQSKGKGYGKEMEKTLDRVPRKNLQANASITTTPTKPGASAHVVASAEQQSETHHDELKKIYNSMGGHRGRGDHQSDHGPPRQPDAEGVGNQSHPCGSSEKPPGNAQEPQEPVMPDETRSGATGLQAINV